MAHITDDRILETTTTTGTTALALGGAVTGFRAFSAKMTSPSDTCWYVEWAAVSSTDPTPTGEWEEGLGTYSAANTLTKTSVLRSSNADAAVTFSAGTKWVAITAVASRTLQFGPELATVWPTLVAAANRATAPAADNLAIYAQKFAGDIVLAMRPPVGEEVHFQPHLSDEEFQYYAPGSGSTAGSGLNTSWTPGGTVTHPTPTNTRSGQIWRTRFASVVTTTNQVLGLTALGASLARIQRTTVAGVGGLAFRTRFVIGAWPAATVRLFAGVTDQTTSPVTSDTLAGNCVGLWHDTTEAATVLNIVRRDGTTATKTAITLTGALTAGQAFDWRMWWGPNAASIGYRLEDINAGTVLAEGTISTNLPTTATLMGISVAMSNGTANTAAGGTALDVAKIYAGKTF